MLFPGPRSARNPGITKELLSRGILESRDGIAGSRDRLGRKGFRGSSPGAGTPSAIPGRSRPHPAWPWALPGIPEQPRLPRGCAKASEGLGSCRERATPSVLVPCGGSGMGRAGHSPWSRGAERGALGAAAEPRSAASGDFRGQSHTDCSGGSLRPHSLPGCPAAFQPGSGLLGASQGSPSSASRDQPQSRVGTEVS